MATKTCEQCGEDFSVVPCRLSVARFCSNRCRGRWQSTLRGEKHHRWSGGEREKNCQECGQRFRPRPGQPITTFRRQKFCSKPCADRGGIRHTGENHPNWKPVTRRKQRRGKHGSWARAVISRDGGKCQRCGRGDIELHAHHIKPYETHPELRWEISNGLTLCCLCHWAEHSASEDNAVNSGDTLTSNVEGNPEPSFGRKPIEGVTTRGRAYRRWNGECANCGQFISKRWSDAKGKKHLYCSKSCSLKHRWRVYGSTGYGGNASTSAAHVK